jgi:hypothetical protein
MSGSPLTGFIGDGVASLFHDDLSRWHGMTVLHDDEAAIKAGAETSLKGPSHRSRGFSSPDRNDPTVPAQLISTPANDQLIATPDHGTAYSTGGLHGLQACPDQLLKQ